ncbi:GIY-YIG nuclease family protein [Spirosoma pollinicola]|uniref:GIY-YIG domain-containing protein n=1 Tax=Spirosoma pollinicola TaxID=2057025 RepID=A0A2K8Z0W7_9BACT|nr:GIY-YIG nuclease family protein [Spirosoma pollinicola]AUD03533.1 hypothetical protein CWM47_17880 [Spirosoma pollinicola]
MENSEKIARMGLDLGRIIDGEMPFKAHPCIYYLINAMNDVVFVGQTVDLQSRLLEHKRAGVNFVRFRFFGCEERDLDRLEQGAIVRLKPALNKAPKMPKLKSASGHLSKQLICLKHNITPIAFDRLREAFGLHPTSSFGNAKYYKPEDVELWVRRFKGLVVSGRHVLQVKPTYLAVGISSRTRQIQLFTK